MRLDVGMVEQGFVQSREKAVALILTGKVYVNGKRAEKPGTTLKDGSTIELAENSLPFVSRGGYKLEKAIKQFNLSLSEAIACDIGASTGGFTDCMLQHGAKVVYAIDVGYGQLDWKLRNDPRVVVMERMNARNLHPDWFLEPMDFASVDVSFISLALILPNLRSCLKAGAFVVILIKPQFEAGRENVGKNGVVRNPLVHVETCSRILKLSIDLGYTVCGFTFSPITGPKGNIEYLALLAASANCKTISIYSQNLIEDTVSQAHSTLNGNRK
ncbi:MAG: Hemolysin A [Firmicutes bacterium ADurb.Bin356]|nr:MAG: Hemolysin A [Firmicutes bacterium ADurb.Bin356]